MSKSSNIYGGVGFATESECCPECGRAYEKEDASGIVWKLEGVEIDGKLVRLTYREAEVLRILARRFGVVVHRAFLYATVWDDKAEMKIVDVYICKLRKKLAHAGVPLEIANVWGAGYVLRARDVGNCEQSQPTKETRAHVAH